MQTMYAQVNGQTKVLTLPEADAEVMPGIRWGAFDALMTPAFWRGQAWQQAELGRYADLRLGRTLKEEVAACLLGGYGMPAGLGLAAYRAVRSSGLLEAGGDIHAFESVLSMPMACGGRVRAYRFPRQKARYLARCITELQDFDEPRSDYALRDALAALPGVGLKTASWIVRNYRSSDSVAVLDVHILRAGRQAGLFRPHWTPQGRYRELEAIFVSFATAINTRASLLDAVIWDVMRRLSRVAGPGPAAGVRD